jgi:hypothetical protein
MARVEESEKRRKLAMAGLGAGARRRSFCFLERPAPAADSAAEERWTVFLVTYPDGAGWRGYFTFRSAARVSEAGELRTADLFLEETESAVDQRARSLGRPLVLALLESALHTEQQRSTSADVRGWFRGLLARSAGERPDLAAVAPTLSELRSLYESYRLDQVSHLIALLEPVGFNEVVDHILSGRRIDFRARDRHQLAMLVVQELERRLPLPPFEMWVEDYLAHPEVYYRYALELHGGPELP